MPQQKPNVIFITAQESGRYFNCCGVNTVTSPTIDSLASEGFMFTNCLAVSSSCSASRGAAMTGRYPQANGLMGQCGEPWNWEMNDGEQHLAQIMKLEGYECVLFRHQDESMDWKHLGFEDFRCREIVPIKGQIDDNKALSAIKVAKELTGFISEKTKKPLIRPFYLQVGFKEASLPYSYGGAKKEMDKGLTIPSRIKNTPIAQGHFAGLQGAIHQIDAAIDIIINGLKRSPYAKNTIIVFTADCGINSGRDKDTLYDGGLEVPLIFHCPGLIPQGRSNALMSNMDIFPTLIDLVGGDTPLNIHAKNFADMIKGINAEEQRQYVMGVHEDSRYIRSKDYKLIANFAQVQVASTPVDLAMPATSAAPELEFYCLKNDPDELDNLYGRPDSLKIQIEMKQQLVKWMKDMNDTLLKNVTPQCRKVNALLLT